MTAPAIPSGSSVVAYLRDSGGDSQELSVLQQEQEIRSECKERGWILTHLYRDEARPGSTTVGRDAFLEMVRYLKAGAQEKGVIIWKYSRLARDLDSAQFYKADLRLRGFEIVSLKDNVPSGPDGRLMESVIDWMNQRFLEDLRTDVRRGQAYIAVNHKAMPGSKTPHGYRRVQVQIGTRRSGAPHLVSRFEPDPEQAPLVRLAFQMRADGRSVGEIHQRVRLYRTIQGYTRMFRNQIYIGILVWSGMPVEDFCEPIVDLDTFQRVQDINKASREKAAIWHPRRQFSKYMLSGLLRCSDCGRAWGGFTVTRPARHQLYRYYACSGRMSTVEKCRAKQTRMEIIDELVVNRLAEFLAAPDILQALVSEMRSTAQTRQQESLAERERLERDLSDLNKRIGRITAAIGDYGHSQAMLLELGKLEKERDELQADLSTVAAHSPLVELAEPVDLQLLGQEAAQALLTSSGRDRQLLVRSMVKTVAVRRTDQNITAEITLHWLPGLGAVDVMPLRAVALAKYT